MNFKQFLLKEMSANAPVASIPHGLLKQQVFDYTVETLSKKFSKYFENEKLEFFTSKVGNYVEIYGKNKNSVNFEFLFRGFEIDKSYVKHKITLEEDQLAVLLGLSKNKFVETLYEYLIKDNFLLMSDEFHSDSSKYIWEKLSKKYNSAILNIKENKITRVDNFESTEYSNKYTKVKDDAEYFASKNKEEIDNIRLLLWESN